MQEKTIVTSDKFLVSYKELLDFINSLPRDVPVSDDEITKIAKALSTLSSQFLEAQRDIIELRKLYIETQEQLVDMSERYLALIEFKNRSLK